MEHNGARDDDTHDDSAMRYNPYYQEDDPDSEKWIHRDKLAEIENEELKQYGIVPPRRVRASSKTSARKGGRSMSRDGKRQHVASPGRIDDPEVPEQNVWDPRLPDEIAQDPYEDGGAAKSIRSLKKSGSRIPVLSSSPMTGSDQYGDRPRTRGNTGVSGDEDGLSYVKQRARSHSAASQVLLDDSDPIQHDMQTPATSRPGSGVFKEGSTSPTKKKTAPRKTSTTNGARKPTTNAPKPRTASGTRPTTRAGESRPTTAVNRPDGDPPWLATMYKPDPRLPPDQQMLPTHAKRLAQEQWEKEGKIPNAYDREFTPISVHPDQPSPTNAEKPAPSPALQAPDSGLSPASPTSPGAWPLGPQRVKSPAPSERPGTSGGYRTMPTVQTSPPIPTSPRPPQHRFSMQQEPRGNTTVVEAQAPAEKSGCGCCIVM